WKSRPAAARWNCTADGLRGCWANTTIPCTSISARARPSVWSLPGTPGQSVPIWPSAAGAEPCSACRLEPPRPVGTNRRLTGCNTRITHAEPQLIRETFPVGPLQCNCTIIGDPVTKKAIVVDPGGDHQLILDRINQLGLKLVSIIHTHDHLDHFLASGEMKKATGAALHLHKDDQFLWDNLEMQCRMFGVPYKPVPAPDQSLQDDEELACGCGVAMHTPRPTT